MSVTRIIKKKSINVSDRDVGSISDYALNVLADLMQASNISSCTITSTVRDAYNQARVMYDALGKDGVAYWRSQYKTKAAQEVISIYVTEKGKGTDRFNTIDAMKVRIDSALLKGIRISRHMGDPAVLQVLDIAKSSISSPTAFAKACKQSKINYQKDESKGGLSHYINEKSAFHIEIPQQSINDNREGESLSQIPQNSPASSENEISVVRYVHPKGNNSTTLYELVDEESFLGYDIDGGKVYEFEWNGKSNNERLWESLTLGNKKRLGKNDSGDYNGQVKYPVISGVIIYLPTSQITIGTRKSRDNNGSSLEVVGTLPGDAGDDSTEAIGTPAGGSQASTYSSNITVSKTVQSNLFPFVLRKLSLDPGYVSTHKNKGAGTKQIYPHITVIGWSKVLEAQTGNGYIDLTPDVINCSTGSRMGGGDFSIELQPKVGYLNGSEDELTSNKSSWRVKGEVGTIDGESVSMNNINREKNSEFRRNSSYYSMIFQQNDMIWIKFERLGFEDKSSLDKNRFGEWYDMIGLIDVVPVGVNSKSTDSKVIIKGRDLTKALEDDNAYFNPYSVGHASSVYGDTPHKNGRYENGSFKDLTAIQARSIQQAIEFVVHRISSIGYVPDSVFNKLQDATFVTKTDAESSTKSVKGIWQCIKLFIDESIKDLRLIDDSISNPDGSILDILNKICQDPFVEFFTDTYGDKFYIIARKPPFEESVVKSIVSQVVASDRGDGKVTGQALSGPRVNTYKEYLNAREDIERGDTEITEDNSQYSALDQSLGEVGVTTTRFPLIINIGEEDVDNDQLDFSNEAYSWYQVTDRGNFAGASITLGHVPALYFDEIAQVFGNRRLEVVSNYSNYKFFQSNRTEKEIDLYAEQASQHLAFLVETNIHLPFTRKGTITLNTGDRRIKKGNYIYYRPTQEIFYVTGVSNSGSISRGGIDRTTVVEVERGMVLAYVKGAYEPVKQEDGSYKEVEVSYFNIADIPKLKDGVRDTVTNGTANDKFDYKKNIKINKDILNFFIERRQFKQFD